MKIGILTQPLHNNYGGLLQSYALQTVLERNGHDVVILNRPMGDSSRSKLETIKSDIVIGIKNFIKFILGRPLTKKYHELLPEQRKVVSRFTDKFIARHHHKSPDLNSTEEIASYAREFGIEAFVVGSDQCWRPMYSPCLPNYFLDFTLGWNVKRISYAASFGVDYWELSDVETEICSRFARNFDAVSVRESSAIELCQRNLGVDAVHVLDPTMLLDRSDYDALIDGRAKELFDIAQEHALPNVWSASGKKLFCYVLDRDESKQRFISKVADVTNLTPVYCMPKDYRAREVFERSPDECTFPPVELWLQSFRDAEMVIADSFHGVVFSIIYNKPFWVLANEGRGMARFSSLLKLFDLDHRMVSACNIDTLDLNVPIDWERVNKRREELKQFSLKFISDHLS